LQQAYRRAMNGILDHVTLHVGNLSRAKEFYAKALAPLGITAIMEFPNGVGFGRGQKPELWLGTGAASYQSAEQIAIITPIHVALKAESREQVDAFYAAAIEAGGRDFGAPGVRAHYHPNYYGAFVLDPDGHNLEAVHHGF
jgi:catechol 2,3-dioxygenase-like lactoylglutathione lyase family enzyme